MYQHFLSKMDTSGVATRGDHHILVICYGKLGHWTKWKIADDIMLGHLIQEVA